MAAHFKRKSFAVSFPNPVSADAAARIRLLPVPRLRVLNWSRAGFVKAKYFFSIQTRARRFSDLKIFKCSLPAQFSDPTGSLQAAVSRSWALRSSAANLQEFANGFCLF
jgi:hypothetical protein